MKPIDIEDDNKRVYFKGRNFRVSKETQNLWNKLSRFAVFGINF